MRVHTRTCACCNAVISAAIHPDDFRCPNSKRATIDGSLRLAGPKGLPSSSPAAGGATVTISAMGIPNPAVVVVTMYEQLRARKLLTQR